ncbi:hypothetical protein PILCRDRAFT_816793 [Piloderma croceum F 1598]|uniref:Uncharacterized protein n=1 Tax=Piloderma croceum (strain F 1598) TaxID=765440 RepID=A0A0C3FN81_PILCF|nr:hypothetical protein PILCRDRAFT_816793 [Piloderma croceum F 1598]
MKGTLVPATTYSELVPRFSHDCPHQSNHRFVVEVKIVLGSRKIHTQTLWTVFGGDRTYGSSGATVPTLRVSASP